MYYFLLGKSKEMTSVERVDFHLEQGAEGPIRQVKQYVKGPEAKESRVHDSTRWAGPECRIQQG